MHRCFVDNMIQNDKTVCVTGEEARHMSRVMRLKCGDTVEVCDGSGYTYPGVISEVTKSEVFVALGEGVLDSSEPKTQVVLFAGLSKGAKMELVIQKSVELGAAAVVPVETEFAVARDGKPERWQRIAFEAAKQCKRPKVPKIYDVVSFEQAVDMLSCMDVSLCAYEKEENVSVKDILLAQSYAGKSCGIFVGPEGGFSEKEIQILTDRQVHTVSLGKRILRTETAAISFLTIVMFCFGEME